MIAEVLIVSRTRMKNGVCVGGVDIHAAQNRFVRLHDEDNSNLTESAPYQIGEVWRLDLLRPWNPRPRPHVEDRMVLSAEKLSTYDMSCMKDTLLGLDVPIYRGPIEELFEKKLVLDENTPFVGAMDVPQNSVCFWLPDAPLFLHSHYNNRVYFRYKNSKIAYVGFQKPQSLVSGELLRMSLANWWKKEGVDEERCYLQLSGWY